MNKIKYLKSSIEQIKSRNKNSGGTGLGMSILKKIIDIHSGIINIKNKREFWDNNRYLLKLK